MRISQEHMEDRTYIHTKVYTHTYNYTHRSFTPHKSDKGQIHCVAIAAGSNGQPDMLLTGTYPTSTYGQTINTRYGSQLVRFKDEICEQFLAIPIMPKSVLNFVYNLNLLFVSTYIRLL